MFSYYSFYLHILRCSLSFQQKAKLELTPQQLPAPTRGPWLMCPWGWGTVWACFHSCTALLGGAGARRAGCRPGEPIDGGMHGRGSDSCDGGLEFFSLPGHGEDASSWGKAYTSTANCHLYNGYNLSMVLKWWTQ